MLNLNISLPSATPKEGLDSSKIYHTLIIGGGPAGLTAAIYLKRKGLSVGIISKKMGGQMADTTSVENYPGIEMISGIDLTHEFQKHATSLNVPILEGYGVETIVDGPFKKVTLDNGDSYQAKTLLIVTGSKARTLDVPGEKEFYGRGVTYCAICDGPLFADRRVIVVGGGNSAVEAALDLAKIAEHVTIIHRSHFRADQIVLDKLHQAKNITVHLESQIQEIFGERLVKGAKVLDKKTGDVTTIEAAGVFIEVGYIPNSQLVEGLVTLNPQGEIISNSHCETSAPGIYAAGDVTNTPYKQIVVAAGEGAKAALSINDYLNRA